MIQQFIKNLKYKGELGYYFANLLTSLNRYKNGSYLNDKDYMLHVNLLRRGLVRSI